MSRTPHETQANDAERREAALRQMQQREAARGCLLALVFEGAAVLAAALWGTAALLEMPRLASAALFAFAGFTLAAAVSGVVLLVQGNLPAQRRLRRGRRLETADAGQRNGPNSVAEHERPG